MVMRKLRKCRCRMPLNIQFFAENAGGGDGGQGQQGQQNQAGAQPPDQQGQQNQAGNQSSSQIDYAKIQQMLDGTLAVKEDAALKAYFKQQGLSQQEAEQAMSAFKAEKAKNQPDIGALQGELAQAQKAAQDAQIQSMATMAAVSLGIDAKTIPYVLKLADLSQTAGQDGKINEEALKNALNKVLEDVPALKPQTQSATGFQVGAPGGNQQTTAVDAELDRIFGVNKK